MMQRAYWMRTVVALVLCAPLWAGGCGGAGASLPERNDLMMYLIMPDRFDDGDPGNNNANGKQNPLDALAVQGGDLRGVHRRLPYLRSLGVNALWLTPVQKNVPGAFHGYWIQDFLTVDPRLGTMDDLRALTRDAQAMGMRVYLDVVCNHTGPLSEPVGGAHAWNDAGYTLAWRDSTLLPLPPELQDLALYHNFGEVKQWTNPYQVLGELPGGLDDLRTEDPRVLEIMIRIWIWWMEQSGCDGFRVDTVKHVDMPFWYAFLEAMRRHARALGKKEFFIFGEVFSGEDAICAPYTMPDSSGRAGFDAVFHFSLAEALRDMFAREHGVERLARSLRAVDMYHESSRPFQLAFIDNHDIPRFLHVADGNRDALHRALTYLYFSEGIPLLYYGTEQDFPGGVPDHDNRESMFAGGWKGRVPAGDSFDTTGATFRLLQELHALRARHAVLRRGVTDIAMIDTVANVLAVRRTAGDDVAYAVINQSEVARNVDLPAVAGMWQWPEHIPVEAEAGALRIELPPRSIRLLLPRHVER